MTSSKQANSTGTTTSELLDGQRAAREAFHAKHRRAHAAKKVRVSLAQRLADRMQSPNPTTQTADQAALQGLMQMERQAAQK